MLARLGRGGMGTVYLGADESGQKVAIKVINQEFAGDPQFADRFRHEVAAARRVRRFCTAPVLDAALESPPWYIVTEYIDGLTLQDAVLASGPLRGSDLEGLAVGVATALSAIHDADLVHRDLKPANVLLSPYGPRVIDFGIARALDARTGMTRTGQIVGTPAYLAPELVTGGEVSTAADVFSWGCVVMFAGSGRGPFEGSTIPEILHRVAYEPPDLSGLDPGLRELVEAALAKEPQDRPTVPALLSRLTGRRPDERPHWADPTRAATLPGDLPPGRSPGAGPQPHTLPQPQPHTLKQPQPHAFPQPQHVPPRFPPVQPPFPYGPGQGYYRPRSRASAPGRVLAVLLGVLTLLIVVGVVVFLAGRGSPGRDSSASEAGGSATRSPARKSAAPQSVVDVPGKFRGTWRGSIDQPSSSNSPYPTVITITKGRLGEVVGRSSYPTLNCGGKLTLSAASEDRLVLAEHITTGVGGCIDTVLTLKSLSGGKLDYSFRSPAGHGTLSR
ncbi:protein kinase domain-containing protein [Actinomadura scrupuli]